MEITVLSAQGLHNSSLFSHRLRPFISVAAVPPAPSNGGKPYHVLQTRVDDAGSANPMWGDKFFLPLDAAFFSNRVACIYIRLYTKRLFSGRADLGWCRIPAVDIWSPPVGLIRHLSYRLRDKDGCRGQGVVNVAVKVVQPVPTWPTMIGLPVKMMPRSNEWRGSCAKETNPFFGMVSRSQHNGDEMNPL